MAFDDLTDNQRQLISNLVKELVSGNYGPEAWALATLGRGWRIFLAGIGGAQGKEIEGFKESDLHALNNEGYVTLSSRAAGYAVTLKSKAYEQYKLLKHAQALREEPQRGETELAPAIAFDETQLEKIVVTSKELLEELRQNYSLSRSQSAIWFRWTLGISIFGFTLLAIGITLIFAQQATPAIANSVAGILTEFLAFVFFRQASVANQRQDQYHRDLLRRQQILDAVQLAQLISQEHDRDRIIEVIVQSLLGIDQKELVITQSSHKT